MFAAALPSLTTWKGTFARNVALATFGATVAQAITIGLAPLIARLYGPQAFGVLGSFAALVTILAPLAALSYPIAIVLPKRDDDAIAVAALAILVALATGGALLVSLALVGSPLLMAVGLPHVQPLILMVPVATFFAALQQVAQQWLVRKSHFAITARVAVVHSVLLNGAKAAAGFVYPHGLALVGLATCGYALQALLLGVGVRATTERPRATTSLRLSALRELAVKHCDFPLYRTPQVLVNGISQGLPVLMLGGLFGPSAAGFYALARMVLAQPANIIGRPIEDVFYPRITTAAHRGENVTSLIVRATSALAVAAALPFGTVVAAGPWLFSLVFGAEWSTSGEYARWLALWSFCVLANRPAIAAIPALSMQRAFFAYEVAGVVARAVALAAGFYWLHSDVAAVALFSLVGVGLNLWLGGMTLNNSRALTSLGNR